MLVYGSILGMPLITLSACVSTCPKLISLTGLGAVKLVHLAVEVLKLLLKKKLCFSQLWQTGQGGFACVTPHC